MSDSTRQRRGAGEEVSEKEDQPNVAWDKRLKRRPPTCWEKYGGWFWRVLYLESFILFLAVVVLLSKESPIKPRRMELPPPRPLVGALAPNTVLQKAKRLFEGELIGPESLVQIDGKIYTGTHDGKIVKIEGDTKMTTIARFGVEPCGVPENNPTCGRPLGISVSQHGTLYVIDAYLGLYEVNVTGEFTQILSSNQQLGGYNINFGDSIVRVPGGDFFFSDADHKWRYWDFSYSVAESASNGRLMWYNPVTKFSNVALFDLFFANGLLLSADGEFLLIAESTAFRIIKYYISGRKAGTKEIFIDNLPGYPDNITPSKSGGYWVGIIMPSLRMGSYPIADFLGVSPMLRKQLTKILHPGYLLQFVPKYGMVIEVSQKGEIVRSLHDPTGEVIDTVTEVLDTGDALYLGSFASPFLGRLDYKDLPDISQ